MSDFSFDKNLFIEELKEFPSSIDSNDKLYDYSVNNYQHFWTVCAQKRIQWFELFTKCTNVRDFNINDDFHLKWFIDGKLNVSGSFCFGFISNYFFLYLFFFF